MEENRKFDVQLCVADSDAVLQADACAWLGHWYKDINQNWFKARNCYKRALTLQPDSTMIGDRSQLCLLYFTGAFLPSSWTPHYFVTASC